VEEEASYELADRHGEATGVLGWSIWGSLEILESLSVEQRQALVLVDFLGFTTEEAGRILGIRASSVRGRMHRARATLRLELRRADD
jgi:DNA-directed RNA polymerase specialized sigma24 family protein